MGAAAGSGVAAMLRPQSLRPCGLPQPRPSGVHAPGSALGSPRSENSPCLKATRTPRAAPSKVIGGSCAGLAAAVWRRWKQGGYRSRRAASDAAPIATAPNPTQEASSMTFLGYINACLRSLNVSTVAYLGVLLAWRVYITVLPVGDLGTLRLSNALHLFLFSLLAVRQRQQNFAGLINNLGTVMVVVALEVLTHLVFEWNVSTPGAGVLVGVLSGTAVLYVMEFSMALLRKSYKRLSWAGAALTAFGVALSVPPPWGAFSNFLLPFLSTAALLLPSLGLVLKESLLSGRRLFGQGGQGEKLDMFTVAAVTAAGQLLGNIIHGGLTGVQLFTPVNLSAGFPFYVILGCTLRVALLRALQKTSALSVQMVNALAVPVGGILFSAPLVSGRFALGLLTSLVGACATASVELPKMQPQVKSQPKPPPSWQKSPTKKKLKPDEEELARRSILESLRTMNQEQMKAAAWAAKMAEERELLRLEEEELKAKTAKQQKVASGAGRVVSGAFVAVAGTMAAGATVAGAVAIGAGAVVTSAVVVVADAAGKQPPHHPDGSASKSAK